MAKRRGESARAAADIDDRPIARKVEALQQVTASGDRARVHPAQHRRHVLVRRLGEIVQGGRPPQTERLRRLEVGAPQLIEQLVHSAEIAGQPFDQEICGFRRIGETAVATLQQAAYDERVEQPRQRFLRDAKRGSEVRGVSYTVAETREDLELHPGEHGEGRRDARHQTLDPLGRSRDGGLASRTVIHVPHPCPRSTLWRHLLPQSGRRDPPFLLYTCRAFAYAGAKIAASRKSSPDG